jgi:nuclear transport factor 2 (NTF2) superfamily protein
VSNQTQTLAKPTDIKPPFTYETAKAKVKAAENAWNTCNPEIVARAYSENSRWRNRDDFFQGREAIKNFLKRKWNRETNYRLMKELWAYTDNRISVRFEYEWYNENEDQWYRTHGNEHWQFGKDGLMDVRDMSANDVLINEEDRRYR